MSDDLMLKAGGQTPDIGLISDHRNLHKIKELGFGDKKSQALALKAAAEQFQAILNQYWVDAMRQSNDTINPDSPLHSKYSGFFEDMLAQQNVATMTSRSGMNKNSITYLLTKQFAKSLGDEGKELLRELEKMSVSGNQSGSYIKGSNVQASSFVSGQNSDSHIDAVSSLANLRRLYESLPENVSSAANEQEFVDMMMPYAVKAVEGIGFNPLVLVAQAALETGWGKHVSPGNNYYGIKAGSSWKGDKETLTSAEFENGRFVDRDSSFRKYSGVLESMKDYIRFISDNPRYEKAVGKSYSPDEYFEEIQNAGYATDPNYADKLKKISRKIAFMAYK
ncbi:MAG: glucosaminidase domain-containing protein [Succinivibrio sp.]